MHLPFLNVAVPANMLTLQQFLVKSVTFDIVSDEQKEKVRHIIRFGKEPLRQEEENVDDIPGQIQSLGYDSHYIDNNMDMVVFAILIWMIRILNYFILQPLLIYLASRTHTEKIEPKEIDSDTEEDSEDSEPVKT